MRFRPHFSFYYSYKEGEMEIVVDGEGGCAEVEQ